MPDREKVIKGLECCSSTEECGKQCPYWGDEGACRTHLEADALALLKAQEPATVEPYRIELADETKEWLDKMDAVDALGNIANICIDWDGYRTADGLGGLINEIWAYARYCADRLMKAQEPRVMTLEEYEAWIDTPFTERNPVFHEERTKRGTVTCWVNTTVCSLSEYGKNDRCWTSRPDEKRRAETPWESVI